MGRGQIPSRISMREVKREQLHLTRSSGLIIKILKVERTFNVDLSMLESQATPLTFSSIYQSAALSLQTTCLLILCLSTPCFCQLLPLLLFLQCKPLVCLMFASKQTTLIQTTTVTEPILRYSPFPFHFVGKVANPYNSLSMPVPCPPFDD